MNIANLLTSLRILIVPFFVLCIKINSSYEMKITAFILFIIACITDAADGFIARKFNMISNFGKFFDPLADKILVISAMICLVELKLIDSVYLIIIISREFLVTSLRLATTLHGKVIAANIPGKIKTILQTLSVSFILFNYAFNSGTVLKNISLTFLVSATIATIFSGVVYFKQNYKLIFA